MNEILREWQEQFLKVYGKSVDVQIFDDKLSEQLSLKFEIDVIKQSIGEYILDKCFSKGKRVQYVKLTYVTQDTFWFSSFCKWMETNRSEKIILKESKKNTYQNTVNKKVKALNDVEVYRLSEVYLLVDTGEFWGRDGVPLEEIQITQDIKDKAIKLDKNWLPIDPILRSKKLQQIKETEF